MSDSNNRNNGFDDYFDLLNQYAPVDELEDEYSTQVDDEPEEIEEIEELSDFVYDLDEYYEYDVPKEPH